MAAVLWLEALYANRCQIISYENEELMEGYLGHVHEHPAWCGVVFGSRPVIHVMDLQDPVTADQYRARVSLALAHETMHTFGIGDSYGEQAEHEEDDLRTCVMDYSEIQDGTDVTFYNNVLLGNTNALCDYCQTALINKIQFGY